MRTVVLLCVAAATLSQALAHWLALHRARRSLHLLDRLQTERQAYPWNGRQENPLTTDDGWLGWESAGLHVLSDPLRRKGDEAKW